MGFLGNLAKGLLTAVADANEKATREANNAKGMSDSDLYMKLHHGGIMEKAAAQMELNRRAGK